MLLYHRPKSLSLYCGLSELKNVVCVNLATLPYHLIKSGAIERTVSVCGVTKGRNLYQLQGGSGLAEPCVENILFSSPPHFFEPGISRVLLCLHGVAI